jgi:hypothetical protein
VALTKGVLTATNVPVHFTLDAANSYGGSTTGLFSLSATQSGDAALLFGVLDLEQMSNVSFSLIAGGTNILSGTAGTASFSGTDAGLSLSAQNPGDGITYTSDVFNLGSLSGVSFQFNTGPVDSLGITGNSIDDFSTSLSPGSILGEVGAAPVTCAPLPKSAGMGLLLLAGCGVLPLARKLTARNASAA